MCAVANATSRLNCTTARCSASSSWGSATESTWSSTTSTVTLIRSTVCRSGTARTSSRGAAPKTSPVSRGGRPGLRHHSTSEAMPAWATSMTQERWSPAIVRTQVSCSSIRATARVASAPDARSSRRSVASLGGRLLTRPDTCASPSCRFPQRVTTGRGGESERVDVPPDGVAPVVRRRALVAAVVGYAVVALLGIGVFTDFGPQLRLDGVVSEAMYAGDDRAAALNGLLQVLTAPGLTVFRVLVLLPVVVWLVVRRAWWVAAWVLTAIVLVAPLTTLLKELVGRVRPDFVNGGARLESLSYPSGHAAVIATLVTVVLVLVWPLLTPTVRRICLVLGVALVVLVGLTRMWLGVHFLSDVVGGWAFGLAWTLTMALAFGALPGGRAALPLRRGVVVSGDGR